MTRQGFLYPTPPRALLRLFPARLAEPRLLAPPLRLPDVFRLAFVVERRRAGRADPREPEAPSPAPIGGSSPMGI